MSAQQCVLQQYDQLPSAHRVTSTQTPFRLSPSMAPKMGLPPAGRAEATAEQGGLLYTQRTILYVEG
jgi:hypothetical protein